MKLAGGWFKPPAVVAEKSPMACTELMTKSRPKATQAEGSNSMPKCMTSGSWNTPACATLEKLTIPKKLEKM